MLNSPGHSITFPVMLMSVIRFTHTPLEFVLECVLHEILRQVLALHLALVILVCQIHLVT